MVEELRQKEKMRTRKRKVKKKGVEEEEREGVIVKKMEEESSVAQEEKKEEMEFVDIVLISEEMEYEAEEETELCTDLEEIPQKSQEVEEFVDIELIDSVVESEKQTLMLDTTLVEIERKEIKYDFVDIELIEEEYEPEETPVELDTTLEEIERKEMEYDFVDIELIEEESNEEEVEEDLDTTLDLKIEDLLILSGRLIGGREMEEPILEKYINSNKKWFPRGFSETLNEPIIVLIGEDEKDWHIPILYILRESMREILEHFPKVIFRKPEDVDETIEILDSTDLNSLESFTLENSIEFLDLRKEEFDMDDIFKRLNNRLQAGFLQRFGVFVVAFKRDAIEKAYNYLKNELKESLKIFVVDPEGKNKLYGTGEFSLNVNLTLKEKDNEELYRRLLYAITGVPDSKTLFEANRKYERKIKKTMKDYSVFVKRQVGKDSMEIDRFQYPLKVAVFYYLLNKELKKRKYEKGRKINIEKEMLEIATNEEIISTEKMLEANGRKIYPDIVYNTTAIEVETLIGTVEPMKKIDETVDKYKDEVYKDANNENINITEIWIVLRPVSALLHYEGIKKRERLYKVYKEMKKSEGPAVKFKVIALSQVEGKEKSLTWNLQDINEFIDSMIRNYPDKLRTSGGEQNE